MPQEVQKLKVVRPSGYPSLFNTPRRPVKSQVETRALLRLHGIWKPFEVALFMRTGDADLVAAFNAIPLGRKPFVITFESHLPRLFRLEKTKAFDFFSRRLAKPNCKAIIPISKFAKRIFEKQHQNTGCRHILFEKLKEPIYPSVNITENSEKYKTSSSSTLRAIFVGGHFARKGGAAVLVAAQEAHKRGLPIEFHIVSDLTLGGKNGVWTDPADPNFMHEELVLFALPNVHHHGKLPNAKLLELMAESDVSILPTISDTFGYSVIESFAHAIPVIGTRCCALPEIIDDGVNGFLLDIPVNEDGVWKPLWENDHNTTEYRQILRDTATSTGLALLDRLERLLTSPALLDDFRFAAVNTARTRFDALKQSEVLEELYSSVLKR